MTAIRALNRKLFRDTWHMKGQVVAIAMVIAGGVATWIISFSTIDSLELTQNAYYREGRFAQVFAYLKRAPDTLEERLADIPGVAQVQTRTVGAATLHVEGFGDPINAQLVSLPDEGNARLNALYLRSGSLPQRDQVVVSEPFAEAHGLEPGDTIGAIINGRRKTLTLSGIGLSPEFIYQIGPGDLFPDYKRFAILWMRDEPLSAAQGMENAFNNVTLALEKGASEEEVIDRVDRLLEPYGGTGAFGREDQLSHEYLSQELKGLRSMAGIVPIIFLGVAAFLLNVVITRLITQQRDQIAVLKAFGYDNLAVGLHYLAMVMIIVAVGSVPGILAGAWLGHGMSEMYSEFFRFPYLRYVLHPSVVVAAVGVSALAAGLGTRRAVRTATALPPAEAMRPEPPAQFRPTVVERLGAQRFFDQPTRMILRHLEREPWKALLSVFGISLAGAILMVGSFQEDAIDHMIDVQFNLAQREDMTVTFTEPASREALFELQSIPGVLRAEPFRSVPVELHYRHRTYRTAILGFGKGDLHRTLNADYQPIDMPPGGVMLTDFLGQRLDAREDDVLTVEVLEGAQPVREVRVAGLVSQYIGIGAYMDIGSLNRMMQEGPVISGAFLSVDAAYRQDVFDRLEDRPRVQGVSARESAIRSFQETMGETILIFAFINVLLAGSIAFGVIYNSARIALSEHSRELASLRVLGFTRGEVAYILLGELGLLTLMSIPLGFVIGRGFAWLIATSMVSELYRIPLVVEPSTYGFSALVVIGSALISAAIVRRRVYRLDLVGVLKTRE